MCPIQDGTGEVGGVLLHFYIIQFQLIPLDFVSKNYLKLKPGGMGGVLQSVEGGEGGAIAATLASRSTREGT